MTNNRPTIGFFTCHLDNDYAFEVCKGVEYAAKEADVNLVVFPGMYMNASYNDPENAKYDYQYNSIFYYASHKTLDALIVSIGSIGSFLSVDDMKSFLESFDIPILTIEIEVPGYPYLYTEGKTGLKKAIEHLIEKHHVTKIGYVSGRIDNADALERLNVFKEVLTSHGLNADEKRIVYGNFSEFSESCVEELLDNNPDLEAIVFANDQMTIGGYNVFKQRGLKIGKDILVTGFDNSVTALIQDPQLTTVDNNIMDLGYNSIYQILKIINEQSASSRVMSSDLVLRNSCGCNSFTDSPEFIKIRTNAKEASVVKLVNNFKKNFLSQYTKTFYAKPLFKLLDPLFQAFAKIVYDDNYTLTDDKIRKLISDIFNSEIFNYFSNEKLTYTLDLFSSYMLNLDLPNETLLKLSSSFSSAKSQLSLILSRKLYQAEKEYKESVWASVYSIRDTLLSGTNEVRCFKLIMQKFLKIGFPSTYVYLYDDSVKLLNNGHWSIPNNVLLQVCNVDGKITVLQGDDRLLPSSMIFKNSYTPNDRRHTMVIAPLFTNEVQHGLYVCEANIDQFRYIYSSSLQLSMSLKFISLMKQQYSIQNRLESSMREINEKNGLLNQLYITDELTKLYNRRGFFEIVQSTVTLKQNAGKSAMITFVDMDNLKQVNDKFGHKDGDFALVHIAETLKKSFPSGSIIGRLGGDEFVAFTLSQDPEIDAVVRKDLQANAEKVNNTCGKPYYIDMSIGSTIFKCEEDLNIEDKLILADELLYVDKRYKRKSVLKDV